MSQVSVPSSGLYAKGEHEPCHWSQMSLSPRRCSDFDDEAPLLQSATCRRAATTKVLAKRETLLERLLAVSPDDDMTDALAPPASIGLSASGEYDAPSDWGDRDRYEYRLEANWFVTRSIAIGAAYETTDSRIGFVDSFGFGYEAEDDSTGVGFNFSWRH
jgi:hypothetical protein